MSVAGLVSKRCSSCSKLIRVSKKREKCYGCGGVLHVVQEVDTSKK